MRFPRWSFLLLLVACPKRADLTIGADRLRPPFRPDDPSAVAVVTDSPVAGGLVVACADRFGGAEGVCPIPTCREDDCPTLRALGVGVVPITPGPVALPLGVVAVTTYEDGACAEVRADPSDPEPRTWAPERREVRVIQADVFELPGGARPVAAWGLDLNGDGGEEAIVEGEIPGGRGTWVFVGGEPVEVALDVVPEVAEDADEQALLAAELQRSRVAVIGITDADLDGVLELVTSGEAYEAWWEAAVGVETGAVVVRGSAGCAN